MHSSAKFGSKPKKMVCHISCACVLSAFCCWLIGEKEAKTTLLLIKTIVASGISGLDQKHNPMKKIPINVRTAMNYLNLNPTIYCTLCCPGCFKIYPKYSTNLQLCDHRTTAKSKPFNLALFNQNGDCIWKYSTQSFQAWLTSFVQQEKIEDLLAELVN
jgi:hypothetical protein